MPITDAIKNRNLLIPVRVSNKPSDAVNVKIAAGSIPVSFSKDFSSKFNSSFIKAHKNQLSKQIKQQGSFLKGLKAVLIASVVSGMAYGAYRLLKRAGSKAVDSAKQGLKDKLDFRQQKIYKVFANAVNFIREKFANLIDMIKSDFRDVLGPQLSAVWDAAKGVFGWVKKTFGWWLKFFLIKFGARWLLQQAGFSKASAKLFTSPLKMILSGTFWKHVFKPLGKWVWSLTKGTYNLLKNVKVFSNWMGTRGITVIKGLFTKISPKLTSMFTAIGKQATSIYSKVFPYILQFTSIFKGGIIASYASKIKNGLSLLAETFFKGNSSLKDKIFGFLKSMKASILAKWVSIKDEEKTMKAQKKIRKKELAEKKAQQAKTERNTRTKAALKAKFKKGIFGNQVGSVGAQPPGEGGGIGFWDIATLIGSYLGVDYLKGKAGSIAKGGWNLAKSGVGALFNTRSGSALLSGGLAAAQGQGVGGTAGAIGGSFAGQAAGGLVGGLVGSVIPGVGTVAGVFAGEMIGGFVGGWVGKNVGGMIEKDIKEGGSPSAGSAENAMYEAIVKANLIQTKDMNKFDDKNRDKYLGIGSDVVGYLNEIWKGVLGKLTTILGGGNASQTVEALSGGITYGGPGGTSWGPEWTKERQNEVASKAQAAGLNPATMLAMANIESGKNPFASSKTGAAGPFQFTQGTGKGYGLYGGAAGDIRNDFSKNVDAAMKLAKDNAATLSTAGVPVNPTTLYLAHQQGANGAIQIWNNKTSGIPIGDVVKKNMSLNWGTMSGGDYYNKAESEMAKRMSPTGGGAIPSVASIYNSCGDAVTKDLNAEMARRGVSSDKLLPTSNLGVGIPQRIIDNFGIGAKVPLDLNSLYAAGAGTAIAYRRQPQDKNYMVDGQIADTHAERIDVNPLTGQLGVKSYTAGKGFIWKQLDQNYLDTLPKNASVMAANPFIGAGVSNASQIQYLERQKGVNAAQVQAATTAALQTTAAGVTGLPGEMNKNSTQTNNVITQNMSSGGRSQGQQINPFEIDDMYILGNMGLALSILNP